MGLVALFIPVHPLDRVSFPAAAKSAVDLPRAELC